MSWSRVDVNDVDVFFLPVVVALNEMGLFLVQELEVGLNLNILVLSNFAEQTTRSVLDLNDRAVGNLSVNLPTYLEILDFLPKHCVGHVDRLTSHLLVYVVDLDLRARTVVGVQLALGVVHKNHLVLCF